MSEEERNPADGAGEAVIDEPTEHALDPTPDPNTEWEKAAADQEQDDDDTSEGTSEDTSEGTSEGTSEDTSEDEE
jgi:hypothetical protein